MLVRDLRDAGLHDAKHVLNHEPSQHTSKHSGVLGPLAELLPDGQFQWHSSGERKLRLKRNLVATALYYAGTNKNPISAGAAILVWLGVRCDLSCQLLYKCIYEVPVNRVAGGNNRQPEFTGMFQFVNELLSFTTIL